MTWLLRALAGLEENLSAASRTQNLTLTSDSKRYDTPYWPPKFPEFIQRETEKETDRHRKHTFEEIKKKANYKSPGKGK